MTITAIRRNFDGDPNIVTIITTSSLSTITAPGFLSLPTTLAEIALLQNGDFQFSDTDAYLIKYDTSIGWFFRDSTTNAFTVLVEGSGNVILPTSAESIAVFVDTVGTLSQHAAYARNFGNIVAGDEPSGTAGAFFSCPNQVNTGAFIFQGNPAANEYYTYLSNDTMLQTTHYVIPDVGNADGRMVAAAGVDPFVAGEFLVASDPFGVVATSGAKIVSGITPAWGGGGTTHNFTIAGMTSAYKGTASINSLTNSVIIESITPGAGFLTIVFSGDPGANTTIGYVFTSVGLI